MHKLIHMFEDYTDMWSSHNVQLPQRGLSSHFRYSGTTMGASLVLASGVAVGSEKDTCVVKRESLNALSFKGGLIRAPILLGVTVSDTGDSK